MSNSNSVLNKVREQLKKEKEEDRKKKEKIISENINFRNKAKLDQDYEDIKSRQSRETSKSADK